MRVVGGGARVVLCPSYGGFSRWPPGPLPLAGGSCLIYVHCNPRSRNLLSRAVRPGIPCEVSVAFLTVSTRFSKESAARRIPFLPSYTYICTYECVCVWLRFVRISQDKQTAPASIVLTDCWYVLGGIETIETWNGTGSRPQTINPTQYRDQVFSSSVRRPISGRMPTEWICVILSRLCAILLLGAHVVGPNQACLLQPRH